MVVLGVDMGGTQIRAGLVNEHGLSNVNSQVTPAKSNKEDVLNDLFKVIDSVREKNVEAIGIGVPSVVDRVKGIVYDVQNIPSWKEVYLKDILEKRYRVPVIINNDANCFALGERYFGAGKEFNSMIGLTLGTGLGGGVIINGKLYSGANCGAAEFGMVRYLNKNFEYYASGQLFNIQYKVEGKEIYRRAVAGDKDALHKYKKYGRHLGEAIIMVLYTYDPEAIILGGSISEAYHFFKESMWQSIESFAYKNSLKKLKIKVSELKEVGILGAAGLCFNENDL